MTSWVSGKSWIWMKILGLTTVISKMVPAGRFGGSVWTHPQRFTSPQPISVDWKPIFVGSHIPMLAVWAKLSSPKDQAKNDQPVVSILVTKLSPVLIWYNMVGSLAFYDHEIAIVSSTSPRITTIFQWYPLESPRIPELVGFWPLCFPGTSNLCAKKSPRLKSKPAFMPDMDNIWIKFMCRLWIQFFYVFL